MQRQKPERSGKSVDGSDNRTSSRELLQYAGIGTQWLILMGVGAFAGYKADHWLRWSMPVAVWFFPLVILIFSLVRLVRDTGKRK